MNPGCAFLIIVFFPLLPSSRAHAVRAMKSNNPGLNVGSNKPIPYKGVKDLKNEASGSVGFEEYAKPIIAANSKLTYSLTTKDAQEVLHDIKKVHSDPKHDEFINKMEEEDKSGVPVKPLGHSPGIGHNNPPHGERH